jgi:hypothetical protein
MSKKLTWIDYINIALCAAFLLGSLYFKSFQLTFSIFLGSVIITSNYWLLKRLYFRLISGGVNPLFLGLSFFLKYMLLIALLALSVLYFNLHMMGLLIGISTLVVAVMIFAAKEAIF